MDLIDYLFPPNAPSRLRETARKAKTSPSNLSRIAYQTQRPRDELAKRIVKATGGKVTWEELMSAEYSR